MKFFCLIDVGDFYILIPIPSFSRSIPFRAIPIFLWLLSLFPFIRLFVLLLYLLDCCFLSLYYFLLFHSSCRHIFFYDIFLNLYSRQLINLYFHFAYYYLKVEKFSKVNIIILVFTFFICLVKLSFESAIVLLGRQTPLKT